jgi:hypothetical protein
MGLGFSQDSAACSIRPLSAGFKFPGTLLRKTLNYSLHPLGLYIFGSCMAWEFVPSKNILSF